VFELSGPRGRYRQGWVGQGELSDEPFPMPEPSAEVALNGARFNRVDFSGLRFASFVCPPARRGASVRPLAWQAASARRPARRAAE
jgi:hypothetical protein